MKMHQNVPFDLHSETNDGVAGLHAISAHPYWHPMLESQDMTPANVDISARLCSGGGVGWL